MASRLHMADSLSFMSGFTEEEIKLNLDKTKLFYSSVINSMLSLLKFLDYLTISSF